MNCDPFFDLSASTSGARDAGTFVVVRGSLPEDSVPSVPTIT